MANVIYTGQDGIVWTVTTAQDLTGADTVEIRLRHRNKSQAVTATGTTTGCTYTTTTDTFPYSGTWFYQVVATYSGPTKRLFSAIGQIKVEDPLT